MDQRPSHRGRVFRHRPACETTLDPWLDDLFPDYDTEPVVVFSAQGLETWLLISGGRRMRYDTR